MSNTRIYLVCVAYVLWAGLLTNCQEKVSRINFHREYTSQNCCQPLEVEENRGTCTNNWPADICDNCTSTCFKDSDCNWDEICCCRQAESCGNRCQKNTKPIITRKIQEERNFPCCEKPESAKAEIWTGAPVDRMLCILNATVPCDPSQCHDKCNTDSDCISRGKICCCVEGCGKICYSSDPGYN